MPTECSRRWVRLADYFKIVIVVKERDLDAITHPRRIFRPADSCKCGLLVLVPIDAAGVFMDGCPVWRDCLCRGHRRSALTAASSTLSSAELTGWTARRSCLTGLGVTARVAVRAGWAALPTARLASVRGFGANSCQSSLMRSSAPQEPMGLGPMPAVDCVDMASCDRDRGTGTPRTTVARCPPTTF